ncbi:hypothetical protein N7456_008747 [Penicillium angulare]|uniref:Uncharacterized protein n=1 Tax=Penicillium angulare TaxID=116970 RepID=A0A9W9F3F8_9EURO|nr:hypothetical protein N7456_008747 [Penicillium angulare]
MWQRCLGCAFPGCFHCGGSSSSEASPPPQTPEGSPHARSVGSPSHTPKGSVHAYSIGTHDVSSDPNSLSVNRDSGSATSSQILPPYRPFAWIDIDDGVDPAAIILPSSHGSSILTSDEEKPAFYLEYDGDYDSFAGWEAAGRQLRLWIANEPNQPPCPINPSTLTLQDIEAAGDRVWANMFSPPWESFGGQFEQLQLPMDTIGNPAYRRVVLIGTNFTTLAEIGPGVLFIESINRDQPDPNRPDVAPAPPMSSLMQATYERDWHIDTLRHVFLWAVTNRDTFAFLHGFLYTAERNLAWPSIHPRTWDYGSPEYDALLGTRLGRMISYLVLGAWPRGTRRIARIVTNSNDSGVIAYMRFDIEPVE